MAAHAAAFRFIFLRLLGFLRLLRLRLRAGTLGHIGFTYRAIRVDGSCRALGRTGAGFRGSFAVLQQCLQVSVVHLVEEVNGGFLVLVSTVDQNIKVVARLGGNGDKLLIPIKIIHQCCVALRGNRYALRLHAAGGGFFLLRCLGGFRQRLWVGVSATGKSGGGKGRQAKHGGQRHGKRANDLILHRHCPPVQNPAAGPGRSAKRRRAGTPQIPPAS